MSSPLTLDRIWAAPSRTSPGSAAGRASPVHFAPEPKTPKAVLALRLPAGVWDRTAPRSWPGLPHAHRFTLSTAAS